MLFQHPRGVQVPEVDRPADHLHPRCRRLRPSRARPDRRRRQEAVLRSQADEESSSKFPVSYRSEIPVSGAIRSGFQFFSFRLFGEPDLAFLA